MLWQVVERCSHALPRRSAGRVVLGLLLAAGCAEGGGPLLESSSNAAQSDNLVHCSGGYAPDPRDDQLSMDPLEVKVASGGRDLLLPQPVLDWMDEHAWQRSYADWHNVRRWDAACMRSNAPAQGCDFAQQLQAAGLTRASVQAHAPGDGYAFLALHRYLLRALKQVFPKHAALFSGFAHVPRTQDDQENPTRWRDLSWTSGQLAALDVLENIEQHAGRFASENELGLYMESALRWTPEDYAVDTGDKTAGVQLALAVQWGVAGSPGDLTREGANTRNFIFYKIHAWLDAVWERYRRALKIGDHDPRYTRALADQCRELNELDPAHRSPQPAAGADTPAPQLETGFFLQRVRPIMERACVSCHGGATTEAGLVLGGPRAAPAEVVKAVVGVQASNAEYALVAPGDPQQSWLYLKVSGGADGAMCRGDCNRQRMPADLALSGDQVILIRQWITAGAPGPDE